MNLILDKYEKALYYEIFDNKEYGVLDKVIRNSSLIFDIGGHIGLFSLYSLFLNNNLCIHYFEPLKDYFNKAKIILNGNENKIVFNNFGILDTSGEFEILKNKKISSQTSLYSSFLNKNGIRGKCSFLSLGEYFQLNNVEFVDLVKMDIEGAEFDVLNNLDEKYLKKINNLFLEYHILDNSFESKYDNLIKILKNNYSNIQIFPSKYSTKIGYIYCY